MTMHLEGVEEENIVHHHESLPDVWKKVKPPLSDRLRYTLAKTWICEDKIFAFSAWLVGRISLSCAVEYNRSTGSCEVTLNTVLASGMKWGTEKKFAKALCIVLGSSTDGTNHY